MLSVHKHLTAAHKHPSPFDLLLTPSWLSGLVAVVMGIGIVVGALVLVYYHGSSLHLLVSQQYQPASTESQQVITANLPESNLVSDIPLFIFWAGVGAVAYSFAAAAFQALQNAAEIREEMDYVHTDRRQLLEYALERLAIRLAALVCWFAYLNFTVHRIIPYAIAVGYAGTAAPAWLEGGLLILAGVFVLSICLHVHAIFLRLIALRPRLFTH